MFNEQLHGSPHGVRTINQAFLAHQSREEATAQRPRNICSWLGHHRLVDPNSLPASFAFSLAPLRLGAFALNSDWTVTAKWAQSFGGAGFFIQFCIAPPGPSACFVL
jgi:hypothetical protein